MTYFKDGPITSTPVVLPPAALPTLLEEWGAASAVDFVSVSSLAPRVTLRKALVARFAGKIHPHYLEDLNPVSLVGVSVMSGLFAGLASAALFEATAPGLVSMVLTSLSVLGVRYFRNLKSAAAYSAVRQWLSRHSTEHLVALLGTSDVKNCPATARVVHNLISESRYQQTLAPVLPRAMDVLARPSFLLTVESASAQAEEGEIL